MLCGWRGGEHVVWMEGGEGEHVVWMEGGEHVVWMEGGEHVVWMEGGGGGACCVDGGGEHIILTSVLSTSASSTCIVSPWIRLSVGTSDSQHFRLGTKFKEHNSHGTLNKPVVMEQCLPFVRPQQRLH